MVMKHSNFTDLKIAGEKKMKYSSIAKECPLTFWFSKRILLRKTKKSQSKKLTKREARFGLIKKIKIYSHSKT